MSHRTVESVLGRLATDPELRRRFSENRKAFLAELRSQGCELNEIELEALADIDPAAIEEFSAALDQRIRKA